MAKSLVKYLGVLLVFGTLACEPVEGTRVKEPPSDLISTEVMTQMLIDLHLIEGARSGVRVLGDSVGVDSYYAGLFRKYDVTQTQFDSSFRYYTREPETMMQMYDVVIDSLKLREIKILERARNIDPAAVVEEAN